MCTSAVHARCAPAGDFFIWNSLPMIAAKHQPALLQAVKSWDVNKDYEGNLA
jgi:hypothetical protein